MQTLNIPASATSPAVVFEQEKETLLIYGSSYPGNAPAFYDPLLAWAGETCASAEIKKLHLEFNFKFINSSSIKYVMKLVELIKNVGTENGKSITIHWRYPEEDGDLRELGESISQYFNLPTELSPEKGTDVRTEVSL